MPEAVNGRGGHDFHAMAVGIVGANADLDRTGRIDNAGLGGAEEHGAVIVAGTVIGPGVGVGVELDQCEWAVLLGVRRQERQADEVIAAQREELGAAGDDFACARFDIGGDAVRELRLDVEIAPVDGRQRFEGIAAVREAVARAQFRGGGADGAWAEAGAGAIARRAVVGHAADNGFGFGEITGIGAAQEAQRPGVGHLRPTGRGIAIEKRLIACRRVRGQMRDCR